MIKYVIYLAVMKTNSLKVTAALEISKLFTYLFNHKMDTFHNPCTKNNSLMNDHFEYSSSIPISCRVHLLSQYINMWQVLYYISFMSYLICVSPLGAFVIVSSRLYSLFPLFLDFFIKALLLLLC